MEKVLVRSRVFLSVGVALMVVAAVTLWNMVSSFLERGLADSESIRVKVSTTESVCPASESDGVHFSGCNSIL